MDRTEQYRGEIRRGEQKILKKLNTVTLIRNESPSSDQQRTDVRE